MKRILAGLLALGLLSACAPSSMIGNPVGLSSAPSQITFIDADAFDVSLGNAMTQQLPSIEVVPPGAATVSNLPPRLGRWLTAVARNNGVVSVAEMKTQASVMLDILTQAYGQYQQNMMYQPALGYNVVLHQKQGTGTVEKIVFVNKNTAR